MIITEESKKQLLDWMLFTNGITQPLEKIINNLESNQYGDKDCAYLNKKSKEFVDYFLEVVGEKVYFPGMGFKTMNDHNRRKYIELFKGMLEFFKPYEQDLNPFNEENND